MSKTIVKVLVDNSGKQNQRAGATKIVKVGAGSIPGTGEKDEMTKSPTKEKIHCFGTIFNKEIGLKTGNLGMFELVTGQGEIGTNVKTVFVNNKREMLSIPAGGRFGQVGVTGSNDVVINTDGLTPLNN